VIYLVIAGFFEVGWAMHMQFGQV